MYTNDRSAYRQAFLLAWQKHENQLALSPVEVQLVNVIKQHPQYQSLLIYSDQQEFAIEENPFLHMSLHMAIQEQILLDKPKGIQNVFQRLFAQYQEVHQVEHTMMACLLQMINTAQQCGQMPSEEIYLGLLNAL